MAKFNQIQNKMNNLFYIEKAKVVKMGTFATGTGNNGPWAIQPVKVEWEYPFVEEKGEPDPAAPSPVVKMGKMKAVVIFRGDQAVWARNNVKAGNPYASVPDMFLNLWLRLWGDFEPVRRPDGTVWEKQNNTVAVENVEIWQANA